MQIGECIKYWEEHPDDMGSSLGGSVVLASYEFVYGDSLYKFAYNPDWPLMWMKFAVSKHFYEVAVHKHKGGLKYGSFTNFWIVGILLTYHFYGNPLPASAVFAKIDNTHSTSSYWRYRFVILVPFVLNVQVDDVALSYDVLHGYVPVDFIP